MASRCRYRVLWLVLKRNRLKNLREEREKDWFVLKRYHLKNFREERVILTNSKKKSKKCRTITEIKETKYNLLYDNIAYFYWPSRNYLSTWVGLVLQVSNAYAHFLHPAFWSRGYSMQCWVSSPTSMCPAERSLAEYTGTGWLIRNSLSGPLLFIQRLAI